MSRFGFGYEDEKQEAAPPASGPPASVEEDHDSGLVTEEAREYAKQKAVELADMLDAKAKAASARLKSLGTDLSARAGDAVAKVEVASPESRKKTLHILIGAALAVTLLGVAVSLVTHVMRPKPPVAAPFTPPVIPTKAPSYTPGPGVAPAPVVSSTSAVAPSPQPQPAPVLPPVGLPPVASIPTATALPPLPPKPEDVSGDDAPVPVRHSRPRPVAVSAPHRTTASPVAETPRPAEDHSQEDETIRMIQAWGKRQQELGNAKP